MRTKALLVRDGNTDCYKPKKKKITAPKSASPVIKKKVISGRNKNQKKIIVVNQYSTEPISQDNPSLADLSQTLKFTQADMQNCSALVSMAWPNGKVKKLLGRLKECAYF